MRQDCRGELRSLITRIKIPAVLRDLAGGASLLDLEIAGESRVALADIFGKLAATHPGIRDRTLDEQGAIRPHVNVFVNAVNVKDGDGLATLIQDHDEIQILAAVSGGSISDPDADPQDTWSRYLAATADKPVHPIFDSLEPFLPETGTAIDLGCGGGRGTIWLLERGMHVVAVDALEEALAYLRRALPPGSDVELVCSNFQELELDTYDVVVACFTLFFLPPDEFAKFWPRVVASIRPGGLFAGQFLGVNDSWNDRDFTLHERSDVEALLTDFKVLMLNEEDNDGQTALGESKHWHVFHVIARKL